MNVRPNGKRPGLLTKAPLTVSLLLFLPLTLKAHDPGLSTANVRLGVTTIEATVTFALKDAEQLAASQDVDKPAVNPGGLREFQIRLEDLVGAGFQLTLDGKPLRPEAVKCANDPQGNVCISLDFVPQPCSALSIQNKFIDRLAPGHREYLTIQLGDAKPMAQFLLAANANSFTTSIPQFLAGPSRSGFNAFTNFVRLGIEHILTGFDHLLFLFGLLVVTARVASALQIVTCFTIAHSITLAIATISPVPAPARIVEPLIAASIVYIGVENLVRDSQPKARWLITFGFGLVHGCGFASALRELGVGSHGSSIAIPLLSFNLGVELGQLLIAALFIPIIWKLRTRPGFAHRCVPACSILVAVTGGFWFFQRVCS